MGGPVVGQGWIKCCNEERRYGPLHLEEEDWKQNSRRMRRETMVEEVFLVDDKRQKDDPGLDLGPSKGKHRVGRGYWFYRWVGHG
jgi:hypothetical protein